MLPGSSRGWKPGTLGGATARAPVRTCAGPTCSKPIWSGRTSVRPISATPTIRPGELNWMTAGRGIVRSERMPQELRAVRSKLFGIQSWVALSAKDEETSPDFVHYDAGQMPVLTDEGKTVRVIAGSILGASSPVRTSSPMFYADVALQAG